jgi:hypothetical protein
MAFINYHGEKEDRYSEVLEYSRAQQKEEWKKKRVHYDLCSYELLGVDVHGVHVTEYDLRLCASMPLIVKSVASENEETT